MKFKNLPLTKISVSAVLTVEQTFENIVRQNNGIICDILYEVHIYNMAQ